MKKAAPVLIVAVLGLALGLMIWWVTRGDPVDPAVDGAPQQANVDFKADDFIPTFDANHDGKVTFEEFKQLYGKSPDGKSPPLIFHENDNGPALDADTAFKKWDRDSNGVVNGEDMNLLKYKSWRDYQEEAEKRGLRAVTWKDRWLMLNAHQLSAYDQETGAAGRDELPFAGKYWHKRYFGNWVALIDENGETRHGYLYETDARLFLLTDNARLGVHDPAEAAVSLMDDADPHNLYAGEIKKTAFDDVEANLELARKCVEWGMGTEAKTLYSRVLIFVPTNEEALGYLGYTVKDGHFEGGN